MSTLRPGAREPATITAAKTTLTSLQNYMIAKTEKLQRVQEKEAATLGSPEEDFDEEEIPTGVLPPEIPIAKAR